MDDLARRHVHAGNGDRDVYGVHGHAAVSGRDPAEHVLEAHGADFVQVPRGAIGDGPDAAHCLHGGGHVAAGEADLAGDVGRELLLEDQDRRLRRGVHDIDDVHEAESRVVRVRQTEHAGDSVPDEAAELRVHAPDRLVGVPVLEPGIVQPQAQRVLGIGRHDVGDGGGVVLFERLQHLLPGHFCH